MRRLLAILILVGSVFVAAAPVAASPDLDELEPGKTITYEQEIPIKIALVGFDESDVDENDLLAQLAATYEPTARYPYFYEEVGAIVNRRDFGLNFTFEYDIINTGNDFEDAFFGYLTEIGEVGPPTVFQDCYSGVAPQEFECNQTGNVLQIDESLYIDAPSVEQWLATQGRALLDTDEENAYFLYFVNWYYRDDFQFHVYTKTDEPDPDTGFSFGELETHRFIAWGGEDTRLWFYDFSAGPDVFTANFDITTSDLDGDRIPDYRIPPIWEYTNGGYRPKSELGKDIGLLTRYVGVDLLSTTSPLYDPLVTTPGLGGRKVVHIEVIEGEPSVDASAYIDRELILENLRALEPYYDWELVVETSPFDAGVEHAVDVTFELASQEPDDCSTEIGDPFAQLYCYFRDNRATYIPEYDPNDYVIELYALNLPDVYSDYIPLGYADNNYIDGTQTSVFAFISPAIIEYGYGLTTTIIHEVGHHIGMSHTFDGYDSEADYDFGPSGDTFFTLAGNEVNSMMSYIDLNWDFSQFDKDNMSRWEMAGYLNKANTLLAAIVETPDAEEVADLLEEADEVAEQAVESFEDWQYLDAATQAYSAYNMVRAAATQLGIPTEPMDLRRSAPYNPVRPQIDPIRRVAQ